MTEATTNTGSVSGTANTIGLIATAVEDALPVVMGIVRAHHNATGNLPTLDQVKAALGADTAAAIGVDEAWLAAHPGA